MVKCRLSVAFPPWAVRLLRLGIEQELDYGVQWKPWAARVLACEPEPVALWQTAKPTGRFRVVAFGRVPVTPWVASSDIEWTPASAGA